MSRQKNTSLISLTGSNATSEEVEQIAEILLNHEFNQKSELLHSIEIDGMPTVCQALHKPLSLLSLRVLSCLHVCCKREQFILSGN